MQQLTQGWILEFQLTWYVAKVILCSSCPVFVSKSFRTYILVSDCSCFHGKLRATFSAVSLPTGLIRTRFGVRRRFKRSAVRVPGGGTPIWNRRGCSSEILNLTPKGDHLGVAQAFCDPYRRPIWAWLKQILTTKRDVLKTHKYDMQWVLMI